MKYLKKFENFSGQDLGRFSEEEEINNPYENEQAFDQEEEEIYNSEDFEEELEEEEEREEDETFEDEREDERGRVWGDEVVEKKKVNAGFQAFLDKQKAKKDKKDDKKEEKGSKKAKPDFLDLDKDGDKKEPMKKAAKEAKDKKDDKKETKGLTAGQKKLPEAMQKAILAKKK